MENSINEQTLTNAHPADAEENQGALKEKVSLGKFKDQEALLSAYNSLESEFTKRCQKIKELESALSEADKATAPTQEIAAQPLDEEEILKKYLEGVVSRKQKAILLDGAGIGIKTPVSKPKTIGQAGELAREILEK